MGKEEGGEGGWGRREGGRGGRQNETENGQGDN